MLGTIGLYAYWILFTVLFGYYNAWQWVDEQDGVLDPKKAKAHWKSASATLRVVALLGVYIAPVSWTTMLHVWCVCWPLFDISINLFSKKPVFYLGTTSRTDKLGRLKWVAYATATVISTVILIKF